MNVPDLSMAVAKAKKGKAEVAEGPEGKCATLSRAWGF